MSVMAVSTSGCPAGHHKKDKRVSKEPFKRDSSEDNEMTAKVVSENQPDAGLASKTDVGWKKRCNAAMKNML